MLTVECEQEAIVYTIMVPESIWGSFGLSGDGIEVKNTGIIVNNKYILKATVKNNMILKFWTLLDEFCIKKGVRLKR